MNIATFFRSVLSKENISINTFAKTMGIKANTMSERLSEKRSIQFDNILKMADTLGYKVVLVPKDEDVENGTVITELSSSN